MYSTHYSGTVIKLSVSLRDHLYDLELKMSHTVIDIINYNTDQLITYRDILSVNLGKNNLFIHVHKVSNLTDRPINLRTGRVVICDT